MRILHIGKYYPPYLGGMETVLRNLTEGLLDRSCEVTVLTAGDEPLDRRETVVGPSSGRKGRLVRASVYGHLNSQPLTLTLMSLIRCEIAQLKPDLVHLHLPNPLATAAWLGVVAGRSTDTPPLAVWYHADITRQRVGRFLVQPIVNACLKQSAGISVSSETLAARSPTLAPWRDKVSVIPFGIDSSPWDQVAPTLDGPFLFVGRLVPYKGLDVLLDALSRVPEAELVIVGEGPLESRLVKQAAAAGITDRVHFAGPMDQAGVAGHLARARALVLPSVDASETFGLVQLEAMAAGVPVIASDLATGVREVGEPGRTCLLVPPGEAAAWADAMNSLQDDPELVGKLGIAGRHRFQDRFTRESMLDRLLDWYSSMVSTHPGEAS
ncbi:MAG: glycosyltransferase [Candidatus Krumholzibacteria bacterium]|nr:glycosyltransferase [Candidatus Krumholzibacteria bacterium]